MELGIKGKVALVAAGSRGIGFAIAEKLAHEGALVSVCGITPERVEEARRRLGPAHRAFICDLRERRAIERWIDQTRAELGPPTIVVTNTGGPPAGSALTVTDAQWMTGLESTLLNVTRMVELTTPAMKAEGWGRILHITSLVAKEPSTLLAISSTLRAGLSALTRLQAKELGRFGITVNALLPGHTETDRQTHLLQIKAQERGTSIDAERDRVSTTIPLGRLARAEEMGDVACFLCSERASYVSGALLTVDGGLTEGLG
jgi:3-oxoacyl-[acyl-carrier protein] reductase